MKTKKREVDLAQSDTDEHLNKLLKYYRTWDEQEPSYKARNGDQILAQALV